MNKRIIEKQLRALSHAYPVDVLGNYRQIIVRGFETPPGYNMRKIDPLITIPTNDPVGVPGLSPNRIYLPEGLLFRGKTPRDYHPETGPKGWAWWCFAEIKWDPCRDDLITLIELLRATMTDQSKNNQRRPSWLDRLFFG